VGDTTQSSLCVDRDYIGAPSSPRNLRVAYTRSTSVRLCFDAPAFPSSCPTEYRVSYEIVRPQNQGLASSFGPSGQPPLLSIARGGCFTLDNLMRGTEYQVTVQSVRTTGIGRELLGGSAQRNVSTRP
jgi:hypothetical protein